MESTAPISATGRPRLSGRYLTFRCGSESYGISVLAVREIIRQAPVTPVPGIPEHVRGVMNLRGRVIPVIDLKQRFGLGATAQGERTCIIVVQVPGASGRAVQMGLVVEAVEEVAGIGPSDVSETPDFGLGVDTSLLLGMARVRGGVKALLDIERITGAGERCGARGACDEAPAGPAIETT
jgi:purine-binding chemotaxis protein CheW